MTNYADFKLPLADDVILANEDYKYGQSFFLLIFPIVSKVNELYLDEFIVTPIQPPS